MNFSWSVRVRAESRKEARVSARNHAFRVGSALSFEPKDEVPSALEHLLAALASDVLTTFWTYCRRARIEVYDAELALTCTLHNPLVHLGVRGELGQAGVGAIRGTAYVATNAASEDALRAVWDDAMARAPIYQTLALASSIDIQFQPTH